MPKINGCNVCKLLRSKEMFYETQTIRPSELDDPRRIYWCQLTRDSIGPGAVVVTPGECNESRSCYKG